MKTFKTIAALVALSVLCAAGCSGEKKADNVPDSKKVGNFVYGSPNGAGTPAAKGQPGRPGQPPVGGQTTGK